MEMPGEEMMICHCHNKTLGEIAEYIKKNAITCYEAIVDDKHFECGDSCENCHTEGYHNDGMSLAMVVGMVARGYI
jgi:NAD(P)H-nitrite reductase large subunit